MSRIGQTTPANVTEGYPVTNLTLVVLLLIPCVVILLLLNCLFLGYKLLVLSEKKKNRRTRKGDAEEMLLQSASQRARRVSDVALLSRAYTSLSEPILPHPVTSSRASSRERVGVDHGIRLHLPSGARAHGTGNAAWRKSAPVVPQSSDSEAETRVNLVPPNSPTVSRYIVVLCSQQEVGHLCRSSTYDMLTDVNPGGALLVFDKVDMYTEPHSEASYLNTSALGPGLDSDFGASAGVSLRILSADSDGLSNGVLASVLEWDYYDPCYVKQNNLPKHKHHRPAVHTKQYWV
uniref:Huluwa n=1 Tax=Cyclopterus lumpus TaxID=8103 RepID=A0A8C3APF6_CYCLU